MPYQDSSDDPRRGFLDDVFGAVWSGLRLRCPNCHRGRIFRTLFRMNARCPVCGYVFEPEPGDFTGALVLALGVEGLVVVLGMLALQMMFGLSAAAQLWIWIAFSVLVLPVAYTYFKGVWLGLMHALRAAR